MGHMRIGVRGVFGILGLSLLGCGPDGGSSGPAQRPIDAAEATDTTNARIDEVIAGFGDAAAQTDTTDSTTIAGDGLNAAVGNNPCGTNGSSSATNSASSTVNTGPKEATDALNKVLKQVRDEAKEHVFRQELVESADGNQVTYKVDPAQACGSNSDCIEKLTNNPLRFVVTANTDNSLDVALLVGQDRHSPATAHLGDTKISVRGNLAEVMDVVRLFTSADQQKDLPEKLVGSVEWSLEKRGPGDFVLASSIVERFELLTGKAKGKPISVTVQPSSPTSQFTINSNTNSLGFKENIGTVDVAVAGTAFCENNTKCGTKEQTGTFGLHLAGLTAEFATVPNATELTFSGLGLGPESSYLALNGQHLTTVDLNPSSGRRFSINFKKTDEGTLVTFDPALDLQIAMAMTNLSESLRVDMPDWLMNEVFDVTLGGAPKPSILIPAATCDSNGNSSVKQQLKVVNGQLILDSSSLASPVEVVAGMCLLPVESNATNPNPMSLVESGVCQ
jgi:hypothetical protein